MCEMAGEEGNEVVSYKQGLASRGCSGKVHLLDMDNSLLMRVCLFRPGLQTPSNLRKD